MKLILFATAIFSIAAFAKLEETASTTKTNQNLPKVANTKIECIADFREHLDYFDSILTPDETAALFLVHMKLCPHEKPYALNIMDKLKAKGFKDSDREVARVMTAEPSQRAAKLKSLGLNLRPTEMKSALDSLAELQASLQNMQAQTAKLETGTQTETSGAGR